MAYTATALLAATAVVALELVWLRTGLFGRRSFWVAYAICLGFQVLVDGWLTKRSAAIVRYDPRGRLDPSFGRQGLASFDFGGREDRTHALALQPDGGIVAVGQSETNFAVARFDGAVERR